MHHDPSIYGYDRALLDYSVENASKRLFEILNDKVLRFNPYLVNDEELLQCAERGYWRPSPSLTQMFVFHFNTIRTICIHHSFDAIFYRIGRSPKEYYFPVSSFIDGAAYRPTRHKIKHQVGKKRITNLSHIEYLQNKSFFVSHTLPGLRDVDRSQPVYHMFRLWGTPANKAKVIRECMIDSKIKMLKELIEHPYCPEYLGCPRYLINYEVIVQKLIEDISKYPLV